MGLALQILGWVFAVIFGFNTLLSYPGVGSAPQQAVLWLMIVASALGLVVAGIGTLIKRLGDIREQLKLSPKPSSAA